MFLRARAAGRRPSAFANTVARGRTPGMTDEHTEPENEELEAQEGELLPNREAMSLIQPFPHEGAAPLDGDILTGVDPDATDTTGSQPA